MEIILIWMKIHDFKGAIMIILIYLVGVLGYGLYLEDNKHDSLNFVERLLSMFIWPAMLVGEIIVQMVLSL